jgi:restriction system protein
MTCPRCSVKFTIEGNQQAICPRCGGKIEATFHDDHVICPSCSTKLGVTLKQGPESLMTTKFGKVQVKQGARGAMTVLLEVSHEGLHKHRLIRGPDSTVVWAKARIQAAEWNEAWTKRVAAQQQMRTAERRKEEAAERTVEAQRALQALREVLSSSFPNAKALDWEQLKDRSPFAKQVPKTSKPPVEPEQKSIPDPPSRASVKYQPKFTLLDKLIKSRRLEKESQKAGSFEADTKEWEATRDKIVANYEAELEEYNTVLEDLDWKFSRELGQWQAEAKAFRSKQSEQHEAIETLRTRYESRESGAITAYCEMVLANSEYPGCLPKESDIDFNPATGLLVVNYKLPSPSDIPTLSEVKYTQSSDTFSEMRLSEAASAKLYDDLIYQIALRTLNELLESDQATALGSVVFNGFVTAVDKGTGNEVTACIISIQASREALRAINLAMVDPRACFRQLKGVGSSKLHSITPVAPIIDLRRDDERFIRSRGIAERLDEGFNLAAMDWEDFEHLIREIFEKEFTASGGEVRVTQASRDGGVDAVAFDPDPIRGGKIVIQAKRYTHTVGVSAVRDLYGTLMNEGATKGILVTTSDYGPDAYQFANGKPITLLSGANLLHLLQKHGTKAHINLVEARIAGSSRFPAAN